MQRTMEKTTAWEITAGRRIVGRLPRGKDLIASIEQLAQERSIRRAEFSVTGAVSKATLGTYDQTQQVFVTFSREESLDILSCAGTITTREETPLCRAHIVLGGEAGKITGGRLFTGTILFEGEIHLLEQFGGPPAREPDESTALGSWPHPARPAVYERIHQCSFRYTKPIP
jgi:hypothetical protein